MHIANVKTMLLLLFFIVYLLFWGCLSVVSRVSCCFSIYPALDTC